jgi:DNA primase
MAMIPEEEIERIKRTADLAAVVRARGVELKPQGGDLVGRCPFHDDHDPSLRVTPGKGLWRCMSSACGATGNVIQFVQRFDGVSFRHAYELLKDGGAAVFTGAPSCQPVKKATVPRLASPLSADSDDQAALRQVLGYYHERLKENTAALAYLRKRGIAAEAVDTFRLGFVDRTLGLRLPQANRKEGAAIRERLTRLGILRDTGHEHLRGRVVFPVISESGEIGTVYGRAIDDGGKHDRHLFLPGPQGGVWNPAVLRSAEVILAEGIIDALSFWGAGYRHVTTGYSARALPDELLGALLAAKVSRVLIAFDRDEAGEKGAAEAAEQLAAHGVECSRVMFPPGYDANRYALEVTPPDKSLGLLLRSAVPMGDLGKGKVSLRTAPAPSFLAAKAALAAPVIAKPPTTAPPAPMAVAEGNPSPVSLTVVPEVAAKEEKPVPLPAPAVPTVNAVELLKNEPEEVELCVGDRIYRVRGLGKNSGFESLRVSLRVLCGERWHMDTLDLCSARQREGFVTAAAAETALKPELLKRDLGRVLLKLEELHEARLRAAVTPKTAVPNVTEGDRVAALDLLRDPRLLDRILADFTVCGVVGEETNKLVGYLAAISRKLDSPLAVVMQSTSAAGKTALMDAVLAFVPPEERVKYSALTGQALYYLGDADLRHKILAIVEEEGAEKASYALKLLQSEGELTIASTGKDPHTGRMETQEYRVEGPVMIFLTTTALDIDEELLNRCLVLTVDEGREQTAAIHRLQREGETLAGLLRKDERSKVLATHRAAQRLLRPLAVVNPFAEQLTFLDDRTRTRRDHGKYLSLIRCIALLHQHQREVKQVNHADRRIDYIEATLADIEAANRLAHEVLGRCLDEMPPQTRRLLELIERMVSEKCRSSKLERSDVLFRARQVREFIGWGNSQLHVHLQRLVALEYLLAHRSDRGHGLVYELVYDGGGKDGRRFLPGLLDPTKLRHPGVNGAHPVPVRPVSGPNPGAVRAAENAGLPSENPPGRPSEGENAHLDGAALAAAS